MLNAAQKNWLKLATQVFDKAGCSPLYVVGGFVRDTLLGRACDDIDLAVAGGPEEVLTASQHFADAVNQAKTRWRASFLTLDPANGVARVVFQDATDSYQALQYFDFAAMGQAQKIETDLARRDFTVNALAVQLDTFLADAGQIQTEKVIDVTGGRLDLQNRVVRAVSEQNIIEDPLRILRGVRLKAQLSSRDQPWQLAAQTRDFFIKHAALITKPAPERSREELNKIIMAADTERSLRLLDDVGVLTRLIPELEEGRACIQMPGHFYDVFDHTLVSLDRCEWLTTPPEKFFGLGQEIMQGGARPEAEVKLWPRILADLAAENRAKLLTLRWATLLHDVGKPRTKLLDDAGNIHFYEHNRVGADMARAILQRLRFSNAQVEQVGLMVQNHLRIGQLGENFDPQNYTGISDRAVFRFLRDTEPVQTGMLVLSLADHAAVDGPRMLQPRARLGWQRHLMLTDFFARKFLGEESEQVVGKPRLVDGKLLMQTLQLPPGPKVGQLLREIEEAQAGGEITTPAEALALAQQLLADL